MRVRKEDNRQGREGTDVKKSKNTVTDTKTETETATERVEEEDKEEKNSDGSNRARQGRAGQVGSRSRPRSDQARVLVWFRARREGALAFCTVLLRSAVLAGSE